LAVNPAKPKRDVLTAFGSQTDDTAEGREIAAMSDIYRKVIRFTGEQVTKANFIDAVGQSAIFHYAGHSAHDASDPLRSSILLDGNTPGPNSVTAVDIAGHRLKNNAIVVLSSCDSSVGSSKDGIGMRGLTSAFLIGGAGSVVGSLWPVESTSTSDLMIRFHKALSGESLSVADALRKAQLSFIETFRNKTHPYYWSGFVVTGNLSALHP
jgi:CHAT domain-containing protein